MSKLIYAITLNIFSKENYNRRYELQKKKEKKKKNPDVSGELKFAEFRVLISLKKLYIH